MLDLSFYSLYTILHQFIVITVIGRLEVEGWILCWWAGAQLWPDPIATAKA